MEEELMFRIKNVLDEMQHKFLIEDIKMYQNLEMSLCVSYKYAGQKYVIMNDMIGEEK